MKVLAVDDDPTTRRSVSMLVESFGYECVTAKDGEEAWDAFQRSLYPIVVTDWEMPKADGLELCRRLRTRAHPRYTYIIMLTARTKREELIQGLSAGADDFMTKPVDPALLRVRLMAAERMLKLERELRAANQELMEVNKRLQTASRIDPLMGIQNRLAFEERLENCSPESVALEGGLGVVMCDVDHFKRVNDTHGHMVGDQLLRAVADAIRRGLRADDTAFRFGGEEIVILLRNQDIVGAAVAAERLRKSVEKLQFGDIAPEPLRVTVSCGSAAYASNLSPLSDWEELIEHADQALYAAKLAGRNCIRSYWQGEDGEVEFLNLEDTKVRAAGFRRSLGSLTVAASNVRTSRDSGK